MSLSSSKMAANEDSIEPLHKKQKCGDVIPSPTFGGGPMYDEATARKILQEVVLVPAHLPGGGEAVIGFDPDDAALNNLYEAWDQNFFRGHKVTPMIHFARKGDLKMCRYLVSRGASTTKASTCWEWFPMYAAASWGHLDVCKFLYANGAKNDIRRESRHGWTPLNTVAIQDTRNFALVRWLVLEGALCADGSSETIDENRLYPKSEITKDIYREKLSRTRERLVEWAEEVTQTHASIITFLHGTRPPTPGTDRRSNLEWLSVHPGIRQHICGFVGQEVTKKKQLHILRQVKDALPPLVE